MAQRRGFTLLELLVVLSLVAILASISAEGDPVRFAGLLFMRPDPSTACLDHLPAVADGSFYQPARFRDRGGERFQARKIFGIKTVNLSLRVRFLNSQGWVKM